MVKTRSTSVRNAASSGGIQQRLATTSQQRSTGKSQSRGKSATTTARKASRSRLPAAQPAVSVQSLHSRPSDTSEPDPVEIEVCIPSGTSAPDTHGFTLAEAAAQRAPPPGFRARLKLMGDWPGWESWARQLGPGQMKNKHGGHHATYSHTRRNYMKLRFGDAFYEAYEERRAAGMTGRNLWSKNSRIIAASEGTEDFLETVEILQQSDINFRWQNTGKPRPKSDKTNRKNWSEWITIYRPDSDPSLPPVLAAAVSQRSAGPMQATRLLLPPRSSRQPTTSIRAAVRDDAPPPDISQPASSMMTRRPNSSAGPPQLPRPPVSYQPYIKLPRSSSNSQSRIGPLMQRFPEKAFSLDVKMPPPLQRSRYDSPSPRRPYYVDYARAVSSSSSSSSSSPSSDDNYIPGKNYRKRPASAAIGVPKAKRRRIDDTRNQPPETTSQHPSPQLPLPSAVSSLYGLAIDPDLMMDRSPAADAEAASPNMDVSINEDVEMKDVDEQISLPTPPPLPLPTPPPPPKTPSPLLRPLERSPTPFEGDSPVQQYPDKFTEAFFTPSP